MDHHRNHQPRLIKEDTPAYQTNPDQKAASLQRLSQYLQDPEFRQIEGFPLGADDDILVLSDPPYYTACPNPFLPEIVEQWQAERTELRQKLGLATANPQSPLPNPQPYQREPFAADVSEGKNNPIYNAHSYHTKVPHKAIMRYILHYTDPGDIVFDGFCGTGMTGVAAQLCGDRKEVQSLGYRIDEAGIIYDGDQPISWLGARKAILNDLSPAATFIAYNYNTPVDVAAFKREARRILDEVEAELGWMYETWHPHCDDSKRVKGKINHTIWSDVYVCPNCSTELVFWEIAVDQSNEKILDKFLCHHCKAALTKDLLERAIVTSLHPKTGQVSRQAKQVRVLINYSVGKNRYNKIPDSNDQQIITKSHNQDASWFPETRIDKDIDIWYERDYRSMGVYAIHDFYTARNLLTLATVWKACDDYLKEHREIELFRFCVTAVMYNLSKMNRWPRLRGPLAGTLYIPSIFYEINPTKTLRRRIKSVQKISNAHTNPAIISTQSLTEINGLDERVDYIFTDPPFGSNIIYSDLSIIWESWLRVSCNTESEAVMHRRKKSGFKLPDYQAMMTASFVNMYRALKPGRWMTVEFHNTQNSVWNAIQEAILRSGFVVADVRTMDKGTATFKQVTASGAARQDLIISAYKPHTEFEQRFLTEAGSEEGAWEFIRQHLAQLPVVVANKGVIETLSERQDYLLFDRMVAFHIQRGASVPLSASQFYAGLRQRFIERDGMFFLPDQAPAYDKARLEAASVAQLSLFVTDEKSSIQWLRQQLAPEFGGFPQTYQEIQPKFLKQLHQLKHEALPELNDILEQNFLQDDQGRWYMPDPNKASDLEKLRQKALLREFNDYRTGKKKLRQFRTEAIRAGFAHAWANKEYAAIVRVAERLPDKLLQEDPDLLMYYDNASLLA